MLTVPNVLWCTVMGDNSSVPFCRYPYQSRWQQFTQRVLSWQSRGNNVMCNYFPTYCFSEDLTQWYFNNVHICSVRIVKQALLEDEGFFCQHIYCANDKNLSRDQPLGGYRKQEPLWDQQPNLVCTCQLWCFSHEFHTCKSETVISH